MPVLIILREVLLVHVLPDVASENISFTADVSSICGISLLIGYVDEFRIKNFWMN